MININKKISRKELLFITILALTTRLLFAFYSGVDKFEISDWTRYDIQSDNILNGNFNLETSLFITAPLFSYLVAGLKFIFSTNYISVLQFLQILLSALSVAYMTKTAEIIFQKHSTSLLCGILYAIYPITLYFTHIIGQESIFQSLFIFSIFYLYKHLIVAKKGDLVKFAFLFSLALLTKSHILLILPFILLSLIAIKGANFKSLQDIFIVVVVIFLISLPYGVYNKIVNGAYVVSSSGQGGLFLCGHNDDTYAFIVHSPPQGALEYNRINRGDYKVFAQLAPQLRGLTHNEKQNIYLKTGVDWVILNPQKSIELFVVNMKNFLMPGFDIQHHPFKKWFFALLLSAPIFIFAYIEIIKSVVIDYKKHLPIISIFLGMLLFSVIFYSQNRFRVITIEPFYVMYASSGFIAFINYLASINNRGASK